MALGRGLSIRVGLLVALSAWFGLAGAARAHQLAGRADGKSRPEAPRNLAVNPFPGTPDASPSSEIVFSALRPAQIRQVQVQGSDSGPHEGRMVALPDGAGTAFIPARRFTSGERVTVSAQLSSAAAGAASGDPGSARLGFSFGVTRPLSESTPPAATITRRLPQGPGVWQIYPSEPTLHPPVVRIDNHVDRSSGDIFLSPVNAAQMGPLIESPNGQLVWFKHTGRATPFNFEEQSYLGHPVLTWWQGNVVNGHGGDGRDEILDTHYRTVAVLHGGHGYSSDLHEFQLIAHGRALIDAFVPVHANLSSVGGSSNGTVLDCVIQELDVRTNRVLWEWHSLGHVPLSASYLSPGSGAFDYFHLNSIQQLPGGRLIISARNTWAVYMIDEHTGRVVWTLGGKHSSYRMNPGTRFEWQHDAQLHRGGLLTVFDDAGLPQEEPESSGKELFVNVKTGVVSLVRRFTHSPPIQSASQGNVQLLPHGNVMIGWGSVSRFSEYTPRGREVLDGHFHSGVSSYRAYRFTWNGQPLNRPSLGVQPMQDGTTKLFASWNGATQVSSWEVLSGSNRNKPLDPLASHARQGFQTVIDLPDEPRIFAVQALNAQGQVLNESYVHPTPAHLAIFGRWAFASESSGATEIPVGCMASRSCNLTVTVRTKRSVLGSRSATIPAGATRLVPVKLSSAGLRVLSESVHYDLNVTVSASQHSGPGASRHLLLLGYSTSGPKPALHVTQSPSIRFVGTSEFASGNGRGGVLATCVGPVPCPVNMTLSVGNKSVATAAPQTLGANETGLLGFNLTPAGEAMLKQAAGNRLMVQATLSTRDAVANGQLVLSEYG